MKPTKMRNKMIHQATYQTKSRQLGSALSKDLKKKYGKRSTRVVEGDSVEIVRGEFKGVSGKIAKVSTQKCSVAIEGVKKEKTKGDKFDVYIHTSNLVITSLNTEDRWRTSKLEGKDPKRPKAPTVTATAKTEVKETHKGPNTVEPHKKDSEETKVDAKEDNK